MTVQGQAIRAGTSGAPTLPVEIAFLRRHGVPLAILQRAAALARAAGCSADEALIRLDLLPEAAYYRALAAEVGLPFLADEVPVSGDARYPWSVAVGVAPLEAAPGRSRFALAPAGARVAWLLAARRPFGDEFAIATPSALREAVLRRKADAIAAAAANGLPDAQPHRSYRDGTSARQRLALILLAVLLCAAAWLEPRITLAAVAVLSGAIFFGMVMVRLAAAGERIPARPSRAYRREPERDLPTYTLIVPLRRERRVLAQLIASLEALDYPKTKLQVLLVVEEDDDEMAAALAESRLPGHFETIVAPRGEPRTKPRALNVALPLARGAFVAVYDAEDVPDPDQLRLAVATFARAPATTACLQARLVIDNTDDNWLTRLFTVEYATLFDVINPGLAAHDLPVPLGGTSNHFRTAVLQELRGWDAWNVTEDADLGIRLALAGYAVHDLPSATLEEAPSTLPAWLKQRTRWMKGFMQVVVSHSREPLRGLRALGPVSFFAVVAMTLGTVVTALGYPLLTAISVYALAQGAWLDAATALEALTSGAAVVLFTAGLAAMIVPALVALGRRPWRGLAILVPLLPLYYGLVSIAAWWALFELLRNPFQWHKTEHGLARTSRSGLRAAASAPRFAPAGESKKAFQAGETKLAGLALPPNSD